MSGSHFGYFGALGLRVRGFRGLGVFKGHEGFGFGDLAVQGLIRV